MSSQIADGLRLMDNVRHALVAYYSSLGEEGVAKRICNAGSMRGLLAPALEAERNNKGSMK